MVIAIPKKISDLEISARRVECPPGPPSGRDSYPFVLLTVSWTESPEGAKNAEWPVRGQEAMANQAG